MQRVFCLLAITISIATIVSIFDSSSVAQPDFAASKQVSRYQLEILQKSTNSSISYAVVIDTATGRCWKRRIDRDGADWTDLGSPVLMMKKKNDDK